jgi:hypothetical protein
MPYQSCVHSLNEIKLDGIIGFDPILTKQATGRNIAHQYQTLGTLISEKIIYQFPTAGVLDLQVLWKDTVRSVAS